MLNVSCVKYGNDKFPITKIMALQGNESVISHITKYRNKYITLAIYVGFDQRITE